jgi:transcriptional regulator with XRE-family HTH domain
MADNKKLMKEIGERLRLARQNAGYKTISDFIHEHKFAKTTYTQYEIGARSLHVELAIQFATFFKTNLIWLLTGKGLIDYTDNDLISNMPEKISQDEFLSILTKKNNPPTINYKKTFQKKLNDDDVLILSDILSKITLCYERQSLPFDFNHISEITFGIYFDVISKTSDRQEQKNIIDATISTFNRMMKLKQQTG